MSKLTVKQEGFASDYVLHGNASKAYRDNYNAGKMTPKTVNEAASRLLNSSKVAPRVTELQSKVTRKDDKTFDEKVTAMVMTKPGMLTAGIMKRLLDASVSYKNQNGVKLEISMLEIESCMENQQKQIASGDYSSLEGILISQINTLNIAFADSMTVATSENTGEVKRIFMDLAMKQQNQCRRTIQGLVDIQNPNNTTFIQQQNNAANQQVNNYETVSEKNINSENEL